MSATAALIGTTAGATALNLAGGLFSNKTNKKIARETNALNYQMFQEANQFNENMWNKTNAYNTPANQRRLLEEAGYNPAALIDAPQLGSPASPPSSVSPAVMQGWNYQNVLQNVGTDLANTAAAMKSLSDAKLADKQAENYEVDLMSQIDLREKQGLLSSEQANSLRQDINLKDATWEQLLDRAVLQNKVSQEEARQLYLANDLVETYGHKIKDEELKKIAAEVALELEKGNTERASQLLMKIQGDQEKARTVIMRDEQRSNARLNERLGNQADANARAANANAYGKELENSVYREFGEGKAAADLLDAINRADVSGVEAWMKKMEQGYYGEKDTYGHIQRRLHRIGKTLEDLNPLKGFIKFSP